MAAFPLGPSARVLGFFAVDRATGRARGAPVAAVAVVVAAALLAGAVGPAAGYVFWDRVGAFATSWDAPRWPTTAVPVRFLLDPRDAVAAGIGSAEDWRAIAREALDVWSDVPTATLTFDLEVGSGEQDMNDGVNHIHIALEAPFPGFSSANIDLRTGEMQDCDQIITAPSSDASFRALRAGLLEVMVHEFGHCFGLAHSEPHPISRAIGTSTRRYPAQWDEGFVPDPVMSYGWTKSWGGRLLAEDDIAGVSLLYPAPGYLSSRGALGGAVTLDGQVVPYAYVQAFHLTASGARAGPGAFTSEHGEFLLEGLRPGRVLLWVRPELLVGAHGWIYTPELADRRLVDFQDQWRWAEVTAGTTVHLTDIRVLASRAPFR